MSNPWLKFYPTDWRSDPRLRMCSLAARGLWIECIALMHEATPYGHLLVSGLSPTDAQLAVLAGAPSDQIPELIGELEAAGVFSRTKEGVIYSRKLTRMQKKAATARNNGRKGGNPRLGKDGENSASDNPRDKGRDKPQKPEARSQSIDGTYVPLSESDHPSPASPQAEAVSIYNEAAERTGWPKVQKITQPRMRSLKARLSDCGGLDGWRHAIAEAEASDFLCGRTLKAWTGFSFDWLIKQANFTKLMEGNYGNRDSTAQQSQDPTLRSIARAAGAF